MATGDAAWSLNANYDLWSSSRISNYVYVYVLAGYKQGSTDYVEEMCTSIHIRIDIGSHTYK